MKKWFLCGLILFVAVSSMAENYQLNGEQISQIKYQLAQEIEPPPNVQKLIMKYVAPQTFHSPTYMQEIRDLAFDFTPQPTQRKQITDKHGNQVIEAVWNLPKQPIKTRTLFTAKNSVSLKTLQTNVPFPIKDIPESLKVYVQPTKQVDSDLPEIRRKAQELTQSSKTQFDAVQKILTWVVDHMNYVLTPIQYDATYSFHSGKGNCQNYSHLAAAMMRAVGIPVRIVNGITLKEPYDIQFGKAILTMKLAQGRHSWIEVYFSDLNWVPFDPQGTELFVSNRFVRVEVGVDNNETEQDGLMSWTRVKGTTERPSLTENINSDFNSDKVTLTAQKMAYGPREMLLCPEVKAEFAKIIQKPAPPEPPKISDDDLKKMTFIKPYMFGNLEFPENVDFMETRGPAIEDDSGTMKIRKNFLVETAEYVTTKGQQYAQTFILEKPMKLENVALALHKFNDEGQLWVELFKDKNGMPGEILTTSDFIFLDQMKFVLGYSWVNFKFKNTDIVLPPGRYWIAMGFTGSPIVNWFFTYGKPVGPQDGTRYKTMFDETWSRSLAFEFNYKIEGKTTK